MSESVISHILGPYTSLLVQCEEIISQPSFCLSRDTSSPQQEVPAFFDNRNASFNFDLCVGVHDTVKLQLYSLTC